MRHGWHQHERSFGTIDNNWWSLPPRNLGLVLDEMDLLMFGCCTGPLLGVFSISGLILGNSQNSQNKLVKALSMIFLTLASCSFSISNNVVKVTFITFPTASELVSSIVSKSCLCRGVTSRARGGDLWQFQPWIIPSWQSEMQTLLAFGHKKSVFTHQWIQYYKDLYRRI